MGGGVQGGANGGGSWRGLGGGLREGRLGGGPSGASWVVVGVPGGAVRGVGGAGTGSLSLPSL